MSYVNAPLDAKLGISYQKFAPVNTVFEFLFCLPENKTSKQPSDHQTRKDGFVKVALKVAVKMALKMSLKMSL